MPQNFSASGDDHDVCLSPEACLRVLREINESSPMRGRAARRLERTRIGPGQVVADLGCGMGCDTLMLARRVAPGGGRAIGLDRSRAMLAHARGRRDIASLPVEFLEGDVLRLPFETESLDACWMERLLLHVQDPSAVLAEVRRVLRPGGQAVLHELEYRGMPYEVPDGEMDDRLRDAFRYDPPEPSLNSALLSTAGAAGFTALEIHPEPTRSEGLDFATAASRLQKALSGLVESGEATDEVAEAWWASVRSAFIQDQNPAFWTSVTVIATR